MTKTEGQGEGGERGEKTLFSSGHLQESSQPEPVAHG